MKIVLDLGPAALEEFKKYHSRSTNTLEPHHWPAWVEALDDALRTPNTAPGTVDSYYGADVAVLVVHQAGDPKLKPLNRTTEQKHELTVSTPDVPVPMPRYLPLPKLMDRVKNREGEEGTVTHIDGGSPARYHVHFGKGMGDVYSFEDLSLVLDHVLPQKG